MLKLTFIMSLMILGIFVWADDDCDACGTECKKFCGTKQFKLCCHNYMRKRRSAEAEMNLGLSAAQETPFMIDVPDRVVRQLAEAANQYQYYPIDLPAMQL